MRLVYLANPYSGLKTNICKSIDLATRLTFENSDVHIFNAAHYFYQYKGVLIEEEIMKRCIDMVKRCDELWVAPGWTNSKGCVKEYEAARLAEIKVVYLPADGHAGVEG